MSDWLRFLLNFKSKTWKIYQKQLMKEQQKMCKSSKLKS